MPPSAPSSKPSPAWRPCLKNDPWSALWTQSDRGAIDLESDDPVAETLRAHWARQLPWLAGCAVVADAGSGPAVLPRLLLGRHGPEVAGVHWICVDSAEWPAARDLPTGARLTMRTGQNFADALPPPGGVDALLSNFGLEYVPRDACAEACWAWLAGGAHLHAVMHASGSIIDRAASTHLADIAFALREVQLFERAAAMLRALATAPADPMERMMHGVDVRDAYNAAVNALKARMEAAGARSAPLMDMLQGITALTGPVRAGHLEDALQTLSQRARDYASEIARLEAMRTAALDEAGAAEFVAAVSRAGLRDVRAERLDSAIGPVAWILSGRKP